MRINRVWCFSSLFNLNTQKGMGPLHFACKKGSIPTVEVLLRNGVDINQRDEVFERGSARKGKRNVEGRRVRVISFNSFFPSPSLPM